MFQTSIVGVILAGGQSRRMSGVNKLLLDLHDKPLIQHSIDRASPQVDSLVLSVAEHNNRYDQFGLRQLTDLHPDMGPLAGIYSVMKTLCEASEKGMKKDSPQWLASFAGDTPFFPTTLVADLYQQTQTEQALIALPRSGHFQHPTFCLWSCSLLSTLEQFLTEPKPERSPKHTDNNNFSQNHRSFKSFIRNHQVASKTYATSPIDPFLNINTPEDLQHAQAR